MQGTLAAGRLKIGDTVLAIDGRACTGVTQACQLIATHDVAKPLVLKVRRLT